ncbi:MAG: hypothetical protein R3B07_14275 [Polyangiaceae bacterium]
MARLSSTLAVVVAALAIASCSSSESSPESDPNTLVVQSDAVTVPAGSERYMCYAHTLTEDVYVDRFDYSARPIVHHFLLAKTLTPEPEGLTDCSDVLFRFSWLPLFGAGKGDAQLQLPDDSAVVLPKGTQVLLQLHLLNTTSKDVTDRPKITLHKTQDRTRMPAGIYAFGTDKIALQPNAKGSAVDDCTMSEDVELFGLLAHMHYLGENLVFETASAGAALEQRYRKDPWNFDTQIIEPVSLKLKAGDQTRVTCNYDNSTPGDIGFGESSSDEMCFLVGFAKNRTSLDGCLTFGGGGDLDGGVPPDPDAGICGEQQENSTGIGRTCSKGGGECASGQVCSSDQGQTPDGSPGFCLKIGCSATADCGGGGATCCAPAEGGGVIKICVPEACRPADCIPAE